MFPKTLRLLSAAIALALAASAQTPASDPTALVRSDGSNQVFWTGSDGHIYAQTQPAAGGTFSAPVDILAAATGATPPHAGARPFPIVLAASQLNAVVYWDTANHIDMLTNPGNSSAWTFEDLSVISTTASSGLLAAGNPMAFVGSLPCFPGACAGSDAQTLVVFRLTNTSISPSGLFILASADGQFTPSSWSSRTLGTPPAQGDPFGFLNSDQVNNSLLYLGTNAHIIEVVISKTGQAVSAIDISVIAQVSGTGRPMGFVGADGKNRAAFTGTDNLIHECFRAAGGIWSCQGFSTATASGDPYGLGLGGETQVFYRGTDNHIRLAFLGLGASETGWNVGDFSGGSTPPSPPAAGNPFPFVAAGTSGFGAELYRGTDQHIHELLLTLQGILSVDLTPTATCTYSFNFDPATQSAAVPPAGATGIAMVLNTQAGCPWTAASNASWLTLTTPSGTGPGSVLFNAGPNNTGATLTGTVVIAGTTVHVSQAAMAASACTYSLILNPANVDPSTQGLLVAAAGQSGSFQVQTQAGCQWTMLSPAWLGLTPSMGTGAVTVQFNAIANTTGAKQTGSLVIQGLVIPASQPALPGGGTGMGQPTPPSIAFTSTGTATLNATVGMPVSQGLTITGGTPPYTLSAVISTFPPGLNITGASPNFSITGTPTAPGTFTVNFQAADSLMNAGTTALTFVIGGGTVTISPASLPVGAVGVAYSQTLTATGGTGITWSIVSGSLPANLNLNSSTGAITGTPTTAGPASFTVQAAVSGGSPVTQQYTITIGAAPGGGSSSVDYYFSHLVFAGQFQTTLTYINYSGQTVTCVTNFFGDSGTPLQVPFTQGAVSTRVDVFQPGQSVHDQTIANLAANLQEGWAHASCTGPIQASILYRFFNNGSAVGEAAVNPETTPATQFVTFAQTATGVAYANPSSTQSASVTFEAISSTGVRVATNTITVGPQQHAAAQLASGAAPIFSGLGTFTGWIKITSTSPILSLSLNAEAFPSFSSMPAGDLPASVTIVSP